MRLFVAINIPDDIKVLFNRNISKLKKKFAQDLKWVVRKNMHITLLFLGEVEKRNLEIIKEKMKYVAEQIEQQSLTFSRLAAFPCLEYPKVLYIGIGNGSKEVINIYRDFNYQLKGFTNNRNSNSYTPHLTIARVKPGINEKKLGISLKKCRGDFSRIGMKVNKISLMSSTLSQSGPEYNELYSVNLLEKNE